MTVEELTDQFRKLFNHAPFETNDTQFNLFEIAGFRHYEEVVSNCYSFFFQTDNPHGLKTLLLESLTDLIGQKGGEVPAFTKELCFCQRERMTKKGKFIDLLLYDELLEEQEGTFRNAIIIENKLYADLYNPLDHYLEDISVDSEGCKVGVVLSLNRIPETQTTPFISITHSELVASIQQKIGTYILTVNEKYLILLKEFLANLSYLSSPTRMDERVKFYYQNVSKINELVNLHKAVESQIVSSIKKEAGKLGYSFSRGNSTAIAMRHQTFPELITYVEAKYLLSQQYYKVALWVNGSRISQWQRFTGTELTILQEGNEARINTKTPKNRRSWGIVADATINLPKEYKSVEDSPQLIHEYLKEHWMPLVEKLHLLLTNVTP